MPSHDAQNTGPGEVRICRLTLTDIPWHAGCCRCHVRREVWADFTAEVADRRVTLYLCRDCAESVLRYGVSTSPELLAAARGAAAVRELAEAEELPF